LGNPPFYGSSYQDKNQKVDLKLAFNDMKGVGVLDYVTGWYAKAAQFIQQTSIRVAFVSTNSISQGEQVGILWNELHQKFGIVIHFAHRTFRWNNEAKSIAAVHVVIIGFAAFDVNDKKLFEYNDIKGEPFLKKVQNINPYLVDAANILVLYRKSPICNVPQMCKGSQPTDGGNLLLSDEEKNTYLAGEPSGEKYIKQFLGSREFINRELRWCFWLTDLNPSDLRNMPLLTKRIDAVRQMRRNSKKEATRKWAQFPSIFTENRQPSSNYLAIPEVSSERRKYIPIAFLSKDIISSNKLQMLPDATIYHFGVLTSEMHNTWSKYVCGRLKSDFNYSSTIVYNNYPWPDNQSAAHIKRVEEKAQAVLDARAQFPDSSLADLYDPLTMPPVLVKAHQALDKAVDLCYRPQPFPNETARIEYLFELYNQVTAGLFKEEKKKKRK
jgi:hypothetical protein